MDLRWISGRGSVPEFSSGKQSQKPAAEKEEERPLTPGHVGVTKAASERQLGALTQQGQEEEEGAGEEGGQGLLLLLQAADARRGCRDKR